MYILFATSLSNIKVFTAVVFNYRIHGFELINITDIHDFLIQYLRPYEVISFTEITATFTISTQQSEKRTFKFALFHNVVHFPGK